MGIAGYAVVIVVMEAYNFILSFVRLRRRVAFDIKPIKNVVFPLAASLLSTTLARSLFRYSGSLTTPFWLVMKMLFALAVYVAVTSSASALYCAVHNKKTRATK